MEQIHEVRVSCVKIDGSSSFYPFAIARDEAKMLEIIQRGYKYTFNTSEEFSMCETYDFVWSNKRRWALVVLDEVNGRLHLFVDGYVHKSYDWDTSCVQHYISPDGEKYDGHVYAQTFFNDRRLDSESILVALADTDSGPLRLELDLKKTY